jgi:hypothetical protein
VKGKHQVYKKNPHCWIDRLIAYIKGENRWRIVNPRFTRKNPGVAIRDAFALRDGSKVE